jgi:hypothetical protein
LWAALTAGVAAGLPACGGDQAPEPDLTTLEDLVGEWEAISVRYTTAGGTEFELVENGGEALISIPSGGLVTTRISIGDYVDEWEAQWVVAGDGVLRSFPVDWSRPPRIRLFWLSQGRLTLIDSDAIFDFSLSGGPGQTAREEIVLERR